MNDKAYPEKGTRDYHVYMLKKVRRWIESMASNPKSNANVEMLQEEADAMAWVLKEIGEA